MTASDIPAGWPFADSPFPEASVEIQERIGVAAELDAIGRRVIRPYMPEQHRAFFQKLPYLLIGSVSSDGQPWASMLVGKPGFISSPSPAELLISSTPLKGDPLAGNLESGAEVGVLGIEPTTRRRNRANGHIVSAEPGQLRIEVSQSFGNCPQYIQSRECQFSLAPSSEVFVSIRSTLDSDSIQIVRRADTFFVASSHSSAQRENPRLPGVEVSHRGGRPGFVLIESDGALLTPDFSGNRHFRTLGNLSRNPRAGLLFVDYENGSLLFVACTAEVIWQRELAERFPGAERLVRFRVTSSIRSDRVLPYRFSRPVFSPTLDRTGIWDVPSSTKARLTHNR